MELNPRLRLVLFGIILIILVGSATYIGIQIYNNDQAPDNASAGGGAGSCSTGTKSSADQPCCTTAGYVDNGATCVKSPSQATLCNRPVSIYLDKWSASTVGCPNGQGSSCPAPANDGEVAVCYLGDATMANARCINVPRDQCLWIQPSGNVSCNCGCPTKAQVCQGKTGKQTATCTNCNNPITYDCGSSGDGGDTGGGGGGGGDTPTGCGYNSTQVRIKEDGPGEWKSAITNICDTGYTGKYVFGMFFNEAGAANGYPQPSQGVTFKLTGPNGLNETFTQQGYSKFINVPGTYTLEGWVNGFEDQAACKGSATLTCTPYNQPPPPPRQACGDAKCSSNETCERTATGANTYKACTVNNNLPPTGEDVASCDPTFCNYTTTTEEEKLTVVKNAQGVCLPDGSYQIDYTVKVTNIGNGNTSYTTLTDSHNALVGSTNVTNISGNGVVTGNIISWPAGTINAGDTLSLTYRVNLPASAAAQTGGTLENTVQVNYGTTPKQVTYTNRQSLDCQPDGSLPETGLNDYLPYILGVVLMLLAVVIYQLRFGSGPILLMWSAGGSFIDDLIAAYEHLFDVKGKRSRKQFEDRINKGRGKRK